MSAFDQGHEDVAAYLLGALDEDESRAFERHLEDCPACRAELDRLRPAVEALPRSVEPLAAPARLKAALMETVGAEAPAPSPRARRRLLPRLGLPRLSPVLAWTSAAFLVAVGIAAGFGLSKALSGDDTHSIAATVRSPQLARAAGNLSLTDGGRDGAILRVSGLPSLRSGVYQAWVKRGREVVPEPTFEVGENGVGAVAVPDDLSGADAVLVTREPRGGSRAPSEAPVMAVRL